MTERCTFSGGCTRDAQPPSCLCTRHLEQVWGGRRGSSADLRSPGLTVEAVPGPGIAGEAIDRVLGLCVRCRLSLAEATEQERAAGEHGWCARRGRERGT